MRPSLFLLSVASGIRIMYCKNDCLRDYQQEMKLRLFEEWELHRSVMVQMPTGTGKTHLLAAIVREFLCGSGSRVWIVAHRRELVEQIEETVSRYGMGREDGSVRVMSIQWLSRNRKIVNGQPDLIVIDEAHHALAETYRELWKSYPEARKLGMTATPCRLNRKGFTDLFDTLITSWSIAEFIGRGWLSSFDYVSIRANSREQRLVDSLKKRHRTDQACDIRFKRLQIKFVSSPAKFIRRVIFQTDSAELSRTVISTQAKGIHIQLPQFGESVSIRIIGVAVAI